MGHIYKRGKKYYLKYYRHGKPYYESTHSEKITVAERLLKKREGEIADGKIPGVYFDKVRFEELAEDFLIDYRTNNRKSWDKADRSVRHLRRAFGEVRVVDITTANIKQYIEARQNEGLSNASINRELAALKRMFKLGAQGEKVNRVPHIPMLKEDNVRKGFFEHDEYLRLLRFLPDYFRPVFTFGYHTGWRAGEILRLTWDKVDLRQGIVRLDPGETKSGEGRVYYLNEELKTILRHLFVNRRLDCPYVFNRNGRKIGRYDKAWKTACRKARLKGKLFHDLRRTAARNLVRSGTPEVVAMRITGHKTRSVFDRYNIVSHDDLREATRRHEAYIQAQSGERKEISLGEEPPTPIQT